MNLKLKTKIGQRDITVIIMALLLFTNLALFSAKYMLIVVLSVGIGLLYCVFLILKNVKKLKQIINSFPFLWCISFAAMMFLYGYLGEDKAAYSLGFHTMNLMYILIFLIIFYYFKNEVINLFADASAVAIYLISAFILFTTEGDIISLILARNFGNTAVGNINTTAITYIFLLIPLIYLLLYKNEMKYLLPTCIGIAFMFFTGSRKVVLSILVFFLLFAFEKTNSKRKLLNNIVASLMIVIIVVLLCLYNPFLYNVIGERFVNMFQVFFTYDVNDNSSTALRMTFIITSLIKCWDRPIFGHGWNSFANMYGWNSIYQTRLYTHCNYTEILFSFGLFGMLVYYWFPFMILKRIRRSKDNGKKLFAAIMCYELLVIDISTVSCYSSIIGFVGFIIAYISLSSDENGKEKCCLEK